MRDDERLARLHSLRARINDEITALEDKIRRREHHRRPNGTKPPCGTEDGYQWHRRRHEPRDDECLAAHAAYERVRGAKQRIREAS